MNARKRDTGNDAKTARPGALWRRRVGSLALAAVLLGSALPAAADEYDPQYSAHPVRIAAYLLHPFGVILDVLVARPAHWLVSKRGMARLFGHERYED